jgi:hypothetical protein
LPGVFARTPPCGRRKGRPHALSFLQHIDFIFKNTCANLLGFFRSLGVRARRLRRPLGPVRPAGSTGLGSQQ